MNLSAKLITHLLSKYFNLSLSNRISSDPMLKYPVIFQKTLPLTEGLLYVVDIPDFEASAHNLSKSMIIIVGSRKGFYKHEPNMCLIEDETTTARVIQILQEIFQVYNEWNQQLFMTSYNAPSVQKMMEISSAAITNPMAVIGMDFTIIGAAKYSTEELKDAVLGSTESTRPVINSLKKDPNYVGAVEQEGYFYYPGTEYAMPSLCVNIWYQGKVTWRLVIMKGDMPLDDTIGFLAEYLAKNISNLVNSAQTPVGRSDSALHRIFHSILTDPATDYVDTSDELSSFGWQVPHSYICILVQIGIPDRVNLTLKSICSYIENTLPGTCAVEHRGNVAVFVNLNLVNMSLDALQQKLAGFVRDNLLVAAYSRKMMGHFNFYRQYQQAYATLQMGSAKHPTTWIHNFDDIALPYLLKQATRTLPAYMVSHERLLQLKYQDQNNESQLYETLRCYLKNNQSATHTANELFIHRSTLLYRIDRIREIIKSDLSDTDEVLYLKLSFKLLDEEE